MASTAYIPYLNFDVRIDRDPISGEYLVAVLESPAGETATPLPLRLPFGAAGLENRLLKLQLALRNAGLIRKAVMSPEEQAVRDFGEALFKAAFNDDVLALYRASQQQVHAQRASGLRVRLRIVPPELSSLPWEYLYDPNIGDFTCLSTKSPIVRYLELARTAEPLTITPPLRILGVVASPADLPRLDVEGEMNRIEEALRPLVESGWLDLEWLHPPTVSALQTAMGRGGWHVLHFIGHGGFDRQSGEGVLAMVDSDHPDKHFVPATVLGRILDENRQLRLVFLNACEGAKADERDIFSSTAATLVRRGIPAVLAMQYEITDAAAKELAQVFYQSLTEGHPVDAAISRARVAITAQWNQSLEWGTPVLTMRSADGVLFQVEKQLATPASPDYAAIFDQATRLYNDEQYGEALPLLKRLAAVNYRSRLVGVMLADAEAKAAEQVQVQMEKEAREARRTEIFGEYNELADYLCLKTIPSAAYQEWEAFQTNYTDWYEVTGDPKKLRERLKPPLKPIRKRSVDLMPAPFAWIPIPAGKVTLKSGGYVTGETIVDVPDFQIAKYPLTNAQYKLFIEAGGYTQEEWWTKSGLEARNKGQWTKPRYLQDNEWNVAEHPVVGVSWYEAMAYCRWLSEVTGEKVILPTEAQWQRAAQGDDGRDYPWGEEWDASLCNNNVGKRGIGKTTAVTTYQGKGDSPFGVVDMSGNVWEWCLTDYENRTDKIHIISAHRVLRGGSWDDGKSGDFRCDFREGGSPDSGGNGWFNYWGFRLALS